MSLCCLSVLGCAAVRSNGPGPDSGPGVDGGNPGGADGGASLLSLLADVPLPGQSTRFDYQEIDAPRGHLVVAHMDDDEVLILNLSDGSVAARLTGIPTARGVAVADEIGRIFVSSSPSSLAVIDNTSLTELGTIATGNGPDGVGWDPTHSVVGVSDQWDGALSLLPDGGQGPRTQIPLGAETGNVVYDAARGWFWITVVESSPPDRLVAIDPLSHTVASSLPLPGCNGAHGLRLHPDGQSAFVACEVNNVLARVDLGGSHAVSLGATGSGPDVLSIDPGLGWLYVAAESGDLTVFDITQPGVVLVGHDQPGPDSHSVAVDPATHRVFFPLMSGPSGTPVLRIMRPSRQ